jgi:crotonobetaine/carnitine-CoA ligase
MIDRSLTLPHLVKRRGTEEPDRVFIHQVEGEKTLTFGRAHHDGLAWAHALERLGVNRTDTIISMLPVGLDAVSCWIGCNWIVAWEVPVNTSYQGRMLVYTLQNSGARVAVIAERYLDRVLALDGDIGTIETIVVPDAEGSIPDLGVRTLTRAEFLADLDDPADTFDGPEPWDITEIFYTSGTTGPSKGVRYSHAQQYATTMALGEVWGDDDCFYCPFPMYHVSGKMFVYAFALTGMQGVFREYFKTDEFWSDVRRYECTSTLLLGAMANFLYRQPEQADDADNLLDKVLMVPLIPELKQFNDRFGTRIHTVFNMTEVSSPIIAHFEDVDRMPVSACGRQRDGYECRVVDEHDIEVPDGELGELIVRADEPWTLNDGYLGMPDKTAEAWRNGWFHTGDGFMRDSDGWFHFVDRKKDAIRRRGENISSMEVEAHVNDLDAVLESAAVAVPSEWGEDEILVAVVTRPGVSPTPGDLHAQLIESMPRFMVPRYIRLLDELPKTPTEKVRKVALRDAGVTSDTWETSSG